MMAREEEERESERSMKRERVRARVRDFVSWFGLVGLGRLAWGVSRR